MYKQLETIITSLNEDLDLVSQRIGSKVDLSHEQFVILRLLYTKQMMSQHTHYTQVAQRAIVGVALD
nr:hypothetical protein [Staphylococcus pettenkoferi]